MCRAPSLRGASQRGVLGTSAVWLRRDASLKTAISQLSPSYRSTSPSRPRAQIHTLVLPPRNVQTPRPEQGGTPAAGGRGHGTLQRGLVHPVRQLQLPSSLQSPLMHRAHGMEQSYPRNFSLHLHVPSDVQFPRQEMSFGALHPHGLPKYCGQRFSHATPAYPHLHVQIPLILHAPFPEHGLEDIPGHFKEQEGPCQPDWHAHVPSARQIPLRHSILDPGQIESPALDNFTMIRECNPNQRKLAI